MPFFVIGRMPGSTAGLEISGPFSDRKNAEAARPRHGHLLAPCHIIEAPTIEVAREPAVKAFSPSPDA